MALDKNHVVTLKYVLHTNDESGQKVFVEETSEENPLTFLYGVGMMIPKFQEEIKNLGVGDKTSFEITPGEGLEKEIHKLLRNCLLICSKVRNCLRLELFYHCLITKGIIFKRQFWKSLRKRQWWILIILWLEDLCTLMWKFLMHVLQLRKNQRMAMHMDLTVIPDINENYYIKVKAPKSGSFFIELKFCKLFFNEFLS